MFDTYVALLEVKMGNQRRLEEEIERVALSEAYARPVGRLRCFHGIDYVTALGIQSELVDVQRFASPRQLMDYVGLTVLEYSSGGLTRRGGITKAGNHRLRRLLVEAAWHYRHRPALGKALRERQAGQDPAVIAHAWRARQRLYRRYHRLLQRMPSQKAVVAVARELVGFIWAVLRDEPQRLIGRPA